MYDTATDGCLAGGSGLKLPPAGEVEPGPEPERCLLREDCWCSPDSRETCPNMRRKRERERRAG